MTETVFLRAAFFAVVVLLQIQPEYVLSGNESVEIEDEDTIGGDAEYVKRQGAQNFVDRHEVDCYDRLHDETTPI